MNRICSSFTLCTKRKKPTTPSPTTVNLNGFTVLSGATEMHFFLAQCKDVYVLYSSGKISLCSWTLSSPSVQVSKLSQQFVFQSSLKVEPGYSFPDALAV